jgi:hypothetical protein
MLCCAAEIGMLVFGIIALVKGKFSLTRSRVVHKVPARIIGVILVLPLIIGQGVSFAVIFIDISKEAARGKQMTFQEGFQEGEKLSGPLVLVNGIVTGVCMGAALVIALATARPPKKRRRIAEDEEDYDDRPRRRRRRDEEEYEDEGRRGRDEEDEPPRRRRPPDEGFRERR